MNQIVYGSVAQSRFRTAMLVMFALLALFVAAIGLYGVMSYSVSPRSREFGIRMAVGASRGAILQAVLAKAATLVSIGIFLGLGGAVLLARLIAGLLYGVTSFDVFTLASVSILLAIVALVASSVPAWRAAKHRSDELFKIRVILNDHPKDASAAEDLSWWETSSGARLPRQCLSMYKPGAHPTAFKALMTLHAPARLGVQANT
jgi:hypothetical protein